MSDDGPEGAVPDTSFVPLLDARQRAMLAEMGVRVWAPRAEAVVAPAPVTTPPAPGWRPGRLHRWPVRWSPPRRRR